MTAPHGFAVLFVCTGNICRSPTAEGIFQKLVGEAGLADRIHVDSAGTHDYHPLSAPDPRTVRHAQARGYDLASLRQRVLVAEDYERFDLVLIMDQENRRHASRLCPAQHAGKLRYLLEFAPSLGKEEVPDPYHGGPEDFELVLDLVEAASRGLLAEAKRRLGVR